LVHFVTAFLPFGTSIIDEHDGLDGNETIASVGGWPDLHHETWWEPENRIALEMADFKAC
jgi:hypothetical protein